MINKELLKLHCSYLSDAALENFDTYAQLLVQWNEKINLTAITEPDEIVIKHFVDSLMMLEHFELKQGASVIDVGTGAGFPTLPVLIAREDISLTLLDSLNKRLIFLKEVLSACNLSAATIHARAEDAGRDNDLREQFDVATSRAVAPLNVLCEFCLPFVKVGGFFVALKGADNEIEKAENAISELGGKISANVSYKLPNGDSRSIVVIKKISQTATKYPRTSKKISSKPL